MNSREKTRRLLVELGLTADEIQSAEELAAKQGIGVRELIRNGLRLSESNFKGFLTWKPEFADDCSVY